MYVPCKNTSTASVLSPPPLSLSLSSFISHQVSELVHAEREAQLVGVAVVVVDERLVGSPDDVSLQLFHKGQVVPSMDRLPRAPLEAIVKSAGVEATVFAR